jgi:hypothetical protein
MGGAVVINTQSVADKPLLGRLQTSLRGSLDVMEFDAVFVLARSDDLVEDKLGIQITEQEA